MSTQPTSSPIQTRKPVYDLSPHVVQLARMIDRLPPGNYEISLIKLELHAEDWSVEIVRTEKITSARLSKYHPE